VNYPWFDYGWDFGPAPPGWRQGRTTPFWYDALDGQLRHLEALGISVLRWFILADGLAYGSGVAATAGELAGPPVLIAKVPEQAPDVRGGVVSACSFRDGDGTRHRCSSTWIGSGLHHGPRCGGPATSRGRPQLPPVER
jgi:hypothetical protein